MSFNIYILNASNKLTNLEPRIIDLVSQSEKLLSQHMNFSNLTIDLVIKAGSYVVPEVGIGAYCTGQHEIQMTLDIENAHLNEYFDDVFIATLAHEAHHACRHSTVGFGKSLFDSIILEGLACQFEVEMGYKPPVYVQHLESDERQLLINKAKLEWSNETYHHNDWFFGNEAIGMPKWVGYDIGYYLTGLYIEKINQSAGECYDTPSREILNFISERI